jgi:hypothetical protein
MEVNLVHETTEHVEANTNLFVHQKKRSRCTHQYQYQTDAWHESDFNYAVFNRFDCFVS